MKMKDPERGFTRREEKRLIEAAAAILRTEFQRPDRTQCPASAQLKDLAFRRSELAESTDLVDHIGTCSQCFVEYSEFRSKCKQRTLIAYGLASIAAGIVLAVVAWLPTRAPDIRKSEPPREVARNIDPPKQPIRMVIDLTRRGVARSDEPGQPGSSSDILLPRTQLLLAVHLPIGSEDGPYEVAVIDPTGKAIVKAEGEAKLKNFVEVLPVEVDLTGLAPGPYQFGIRQAQAQWRTYQIVLKQ